MRHDARNRHFVGGFEIRWSSPTGFWSFRTDQDDAGNYDYTDNHAGILGFVYRVEIRTFELNSSLPGGHGTLTTRCHGSTF